MTKDLVIVGFPQAALRVVVIDENNNQLAAMNCWMPDLAPCVREIMNEHQISNCLIYGPSEYTQKLEEICGNILDCPIKSEEA